jgi:hypothetical protein
MSFHDYHDYDIPFFRVARHLAFWTGALEAGCSITLITSTIFLATLVLRLGLLVSATCSHTHVAVRLHMLLDRISIRSRIVPCAENAGTNGSPLSLNALALFLRVPGSRTLDSKTHDASLFPNLCTKDTPPVVKHIQSRWLRISKACLG